MILKDGYLKIKTRADISDLKKDLTSARKELERLKKEEEKLNSRKLEIDAKINIDDKEFETKIEEIERKWQTELKVNTTYSGNRAIIDENKKLQINTKYQNQMANLYMQQEKKRQQAIFQEKRIGAQLSKNNMRQEELNTTIEEMDSELQGVNASTSQISKVADNLKDKMGSIVKKVGKWALAVFGVRSAYSAVRTAMSTISQYDDQISTDVNYIQYVLAYTLYPVVKALINLVYKLMAYVNYLAKAWFNIDLFANSSVSAFKKANQSAKTLGKTLSGFDEINQLSDNSSDSSSVSTPSIDLEDVEIPSWLVKLKEALQPIVDFFTEIYDKYGGVVTAIVAVVGAIMLFAGIKGIITLISGLGKSVSGISVDFTEFFSKLGTATEVIASLGGLTLVIDSICNLIDTFSESGMTLTEVAELLGIVLGEVAVAFVVLMGVMTALEPSWQSIAGAAVIFAGLAAVLLSVSALMEAFAETGMSVNDVGALLGAIFLTIVGLMASIVLLGPAMTAGLVPFSVLMAEISAVLIVMALTLPIILDALGDFIEQTAPSLCMILTTIGDLITDIIYALGTTLPPIIESVGNVFQTIFDGVSNVVDEVGNTIVNILNAIGELVNSVLGSLLDFVNELGPAINNFVDNVITAVTKLINFIISGIEYLVNTLLIPAYNTIAKALSNLPLVSIKTASTISIARFKPTLMAGGGIIDVPKTGVPLASNVIAGEAGAEGVLPLTNEETMSRLGESIGKYITLNLDITNEIDGRVLNKRLQTIKDNTSFARNGG